MKDLDLRLEKYNIQHFIKEYYGSMNASQRRTGNGRPLDRVQSHGEQLEYLDYGEIYDFYSRHLEIATSLKAINSIMTPAWNIPASSPFLQG